MSWNFIDPVPNLSLSDIFPVSVRALSWLARASKDSAFPQSRSVQIAGGARMLGGLDYHHDNFLDRLKQLAAYYERQDAFIKHSVEQPMATESERAVLESLHHEAFAYLNKLGQFYTFAKAFSFEQLLPRASELMLFRNKHTAHRSIDAPRKEDDPQQQEVQAMAFGFHYLSIASFPVFGIRNNQTYVQFHMRDDHPVIMQQALGVLHAIHSVPT